MSERSPYQKDSHCSYCGRPFEAQQPWPHHCHHCGNITYQNPLPVSVVLLPVDSGLLAVRRTIEPGKGKLALPGGFIELGESWQEAGARELWEETGLEISPDALSLYRVHSAPDSTLLVFGLAPPWPQTELPPHTPNAESSEAVILYAPAELAFSLHTRVVASYFAERAGS